MTTRHSAMHDEEEAALRATIQWARATVRVMEPIRAAQSGRVHFRPGATGGSIVGPRRAGLDGLFEKRRRELTVQIAMPVHLVSRELHLPEQFCHRPLGRQLHREGGPGTIAAPCHREDVADEALSWPERD